MGIINIGGYDFDSSTLQDLSNSLNNQIVKDKASNLNIPKPPKKGEIMTCQYCGQPMPPDGFSKIPAVRKMEFKWHVHNDCFQKAFNKCDRMG